MMKNLFLVFSLLPATLCQAADSTTTITSSAPSAATHWKAETSGSYFSLDGERAANNNLYSFGNYWIYDQRLSVQYKSEDWTFLAQGHRIENDAQMSVLGGAYRDEKTEGFGDSFVDAVHSFHRDSAWSVIGDLGLSIPTGSIDKANASFPQMHYAYFLQLGSGTYDPELGVTGLYYGQKWVHLGTHLNTFQRTGWNSEGYRLGNLYKAEGWADFPMAYGFAPRIAGSYKIKDGIHGADHTLPRMALTEYYYHEQADWAVTTALRFDHALFGTTHLVAEAGLPLAQGMKNIDDVDVAENFYGMVAVNGEF